MIYTKQPSQSNITSCAQIVHFPSSRHSCDSPVTTPTSTDPMPPTPTIPIPLPHSRVATSFLLPAGGDEP